MHLPCSLGAETPTSNKGNLNSKRPCVKARQSSPCLPGCVGVSISLFLRLQWRLAGLMCFIWWGFLLFSFCWWVKNICSSTWGKSTMPGSAWLWLALPISTIKDVIPHWGLWRKLCNNCSASYFWVCLRKGNSIWSLCSKDFWVKFCG